MPYLSTYTVKILSVFPPGPEFIDQIGELTDEAIGEEEAFQDGGAYCEVSATRVGPIDHTLDELSLEGAEAMLPHDRSSMMSPPPDFLRYDHDGNPRYEENE